MGTTKDNEARRRVEIELKGKKYIVQELDLEEMGLIENFIRSRNAQMYRDMSAGLEEEVREAGVRELLARPVSPKEYSLEMTSGDCVLYAGFLMLRSNPGVTREGMEQIVDRSNLQILKTAMESVEGDDEDKDPPKAEPDSDSRAGKSEPPSPDTIPDGRTPTQED